MPHLFSGVSPRTSFFIGIGATILIGFVVGFFVLLSMVIKNSNSIVAQTESVQSGQPSKASETAQVRIAPVTDEDWYRGAKNARVTIVEYSDLECPFCQKFHPIMQQVIDTYGDQVKWVYRHYPLVSLHSKAPKEAEAAECAGELGGNEKFWAFVDRLFEVSPANNGFNLAELPDVAQYVGLDREKFISCLDSGKYANKVRAQTNDAIAAGGQGTPYNVIITPEEELIPVSGMVPYAQIASFLDQILAS